MLRRITHGVFKGSWWIAILAIVLVAIYLLLGRLLAYAVATNQEEIEAFLQEHGLEFVEIGTIEGRWDVHDPRISLTQVTLAPAGEPVLEIDELNLRVNSFRSLLERKVIVTEMEVVGLRFVLERDEEGFWIQGLARQGSGSFDFQYLFDSMPYIESLNMSGIDIDLVDEDLRLNLRSKPGIPWVISREGDTRLVSFPVYVERTLDDGLVQSNRISLSGHYQGNPTSPSFVSYMYLDVPTMDLEYFLPEIRLGEQVMAAANLQTQIWMKTDSSGVDVTGELVIRDVLTGEQELVVLLDKASTNFRYQGASFDNGVLAVPSIALYRDDATFDLQNLSLVIGRDAGGLKLAGKLQSIAVEELVSMVELAGAGSLIPARIEETIRQVAPGGSLTDIRFSSALNGDGLHLVSRLSNLSMQAYLGIPAVDSVNGLVSVEPGKGYIDIDNEVFNLNFANMFPESWPFDSGRGRVTWRVDDDQVRVSSGLIELVKGDMRASGKLAVNLPPTRSEQTWGLTIGITDAALLDAGKFLPNTLPENLSNWLREAIGGGKGISSGLTFHGALFRDAPGVRKSHDLFFEVEQGIIRYLPDWPALHDMQGTVHVSSYSVKADGVTGRVFDTMVTDANVNVPIPPPGGAVDTVKVTAEATGGMTDGIRILNETPLSETTSRMAERWRGEGSLQAMLAIDVPLGPRSTEPVGIDTSITIGEAAGEAMLEMPDFDLQIDGLQGGISYHNERGLSSEAFHGRMFSEDVTGSIATRTLDAGSGEIVVNVIGKVAADELYQWSDQVLLSRASGKLDYEVDVHVPFGGEKNEIYIEATSDLYGVTLDLPAPLDKLEADSRHVFVYRQHFEDAGFRVELSLDDQIQASLKVEDGITTGGRIHFGDEPFGAVTYDAIRMSGEVDYVNFEQWMDTMDSLGSLSSVSLEHEISQHVESLSLDIGKLEVFELELEDVKAVVLREPKQWLAYLDNDMLKGQITVADEDDAPLVIALDRLSFEGEGEGGDPFSEMDPLEMVPLDFSTRQLFLDGEDYGQWSFHYRVRDGVAHIESLDATALGLRLLPGSRAEWRLEDGQHSSAFYGDIRIEDLGLALKRFGFASSIVGEGLRLRTAVSWPGSPAMIDVENIKGTVEFKEGKGRFVQAETGGALKLLGIFDFASLARRFRFDFSDVVEKGFEFTDISGVTFFNNGEIEVREPVVIDGSSGKFKVGGSVNLKTRALDSDMIVTLPVGKTLPWYAAYSAIATGPLVGAGVMLAQKVFEHQIDQMSSAKYKIAGTIEEPEIEFVSIFNDDVRETSAQ